MTSPSKLVPEKITIIDFRIVKGLVECPFEFQISDIEQFQSVLDFDMGFNQEKKFVKADLKINILTHSKGQVFTEAKSEFHIVIVYHVDNLEELLVIDDAIKSVSVDAGLANAIASITYSTSRGILLTRLQGTAMKDFKLPVISPNSIIKQGTVKL